MTLFRNKYRFPATGQTDGITHRADMSREKRMQQYQEHFAAIGMLWCQRKEE